MLFEWKWLYWKWNFELNGHYIEYWESFYDSSRVYEWWFTLRLNKGCETLTNWDISIYSKMNSILWMLIIMQGPFVRKKNGVG